MIQLISQHGEVNYNICEYVIDDISELKTLPKHCGMGSTALVIKTGKVYIKNGEGEWTIFGQPQNS